MNWLYKVALVCCLFCGLIGCFDSRRQAFDLKHSEGSSLKYDPPVPERWKLSNGLEIVFLKNDELPLLQGTLYFRRGSLSLPQISPGIVAATGSQIRLGGAGDYTALQLDTELEKLSASISSDISNEFGGVSFSGLVSDREKLFKLFSSVVLAPRFEESRLALWKGQTLEAISRRKEDPDVVSNIAFNQLLYGDSPYGYVLKSDLVKKIKRVDLLRVHRQIARPDRAIFAISGAIDLKELDRLVKKYFGDWEPRNFDLPPPPNLEVSQRTGIFLIELPFEQSTIIMGQRGIKRLSPQHIPSLIFNDIFGTGGFSARLVQIVRVDLGLAYSAYGAVVPGIVQGKNLIGIQTKSESTVVAMEAAMRVLKGMQSKPVSKTELSETKRSIENSFVFKFATQAALVDRYALLDLLSYPWDYDRTYLDKISNIDLEGVQNVAKSLWDSNNFTVLVVGNAQACKSVELAAKEPDFVFAGLPISHLKFNESI